MRFWRFGKKGGIRREAVFTFYASYFRRGRLPDARFMQNAPPEQIEKVKIELAAEELKLSSAQSALKDLQ